MKIHKTRFTRLSGSDYREIHSETLMLYRKISTKTKRRPYIRSAYFHNDKIFLDYFWHHLWQKNWRDRIRRLKYFGCGLELIQRSRIEPMSKQNPNKSSEILHRFAGLSQDNEIFYVQIKGDKKTDQKSLVSIFPEQ